LTMMVLSRMFTKPSMTSHIYLLPTISSSALQILIFSRQYGKKNAFPISTVIAHVNKHQNNHKRWDELDIQAQINILADHQADAIYWKSPCQTTSLFPTCWVPGTCAALYHDNFQQVTSRGIPDYIGRAKHTPVMKQYLIQRSHEARVVTNHGTT
jgi:hypothetical protein